MAKPKVGLALGSGGARGLAHIGVLKVLQQENISVDFVAGSSMGSLVGVLFANELPLDMVEQLAIHLPRNRWLDLTVPKRGFVIGKKVKELIRLLTHGKNLEDFPIPIAVVATDLVKGEQVVFRNGPADLAVRASISIPGIFEPVEWKGRTLVDGGVIDRIPIQVLKQMGADVIIAVDVVPDSPQVRIDTYFDVIAQTLSVMEREILNHRSVAANVLIHPDLEEISPTAFTDVDECIRRGEEAARAQLDSIRNLIGEWGGVR
ncbi:patatin-like phospholipase family protein [Desmospora activa]|uniref:NTE family protein n=1 Tax=Desmospora activa DSM 45169 TaxID=1121389 RepID=A0A2T4ZB52_9BACL|nr:patatin-like phospholipase family protein [Desmospora activa]PTM59110.1 NTE family protein [Desmospora activa DSM 45169]